MKRRQLRIVHRIAILGVIGIIGLVLAGAIYFIGLYAQRGYQQGAAETRAVSVIANDLRAALTDARKTEMEFLLRNDDIYVGLHEMLVKSILRWLDELKQKSRDAGMDEIAAQTDELERNFKTYVTHFGALVEAKRKLGLDTSSGLQEALLRSAHAIEAELEKFDEPALLVQLLTLRRREKDFMLRGEGRYPAEFTHDAAEFAATLPTADIPRGAIDTILGKLSAYQRDFKAFVDTAQVVAREQKAMVEAYGAIEPVIRTLFETVERVRSNSADAEASAQAATTLLMQVAVVVILVAQGLCAFFFGRSIGPELKRLADGFEGTVRRIANTVSSAAAELEAAAGTLTTSAASTQELSAVVANASEDASGNVQSVAAAAEQLAASVGEIGRQVQDSSRIAGEAVAQAARTDARIAQLSDAAQRIGDVVALITAIAEQTNLLALNATIEAARAGDAGRGFAVVASEVKSLAMQTAKATSEIANQVTAVQAATGESVAAIKEIGATISRVSDIASAIAAAVEEQTATTRDISRSVQQAAHGTAQVAGNIAEVARAAGETGSSSGQVLASARELTREGANLNGEVEEFLKTVRAA